MVARVLETAGYNVTHASSGPEAIAKFRAARPDLVLLDLRMPVMDGWEVFDEISGCDPLVPVIVITAWSNQYEEAVRRGIDALMEKPLDLPLLLETIKQLLAESEEARARRLTARSFTTALLTTASRDT